MNLQPDTLTFKLGSMRLGIRLMRLACGIFIALGLTALLVTVGYHIDRHLPLSTHGRSIWLDLVILTSVGGSILAAAVAFHPQIPLMQLARSVERHWPVLNERLLTTLDLQTSGTSVAFSSSLLSAIQSETLETTEQLNFNEAIDRSPLKRSGFFLIISLLALIADSIIAGPAFAVWIARLVHPSQDIAPYAATRVRVLPNSTLYAAGSKASIQVEAWGVPTTSARLMIRPKDITGSKWTTITLTDPRRNTTGRQIFECVLPNLTQSLELKAFANDGQSNPYTITVVPRPAIRSIQLTLRFPQYMHRSVQSIDSPSGDFAAPVGTRVSVNANATTDLQSVRATVEGKISPHWTVDGERIHGDLTVWHDESYSLSVQDEHGFYNAAPLTATIHAEQDQPPTVQVLRPAIDMVLTPNGSLPLVADATDDYGVAAMDLNYKSFHNNDLLASNPMIVDGHGSLSLPGNMGGTQADVAARWHINSINAKSGQTIVYDVSATDNDNIAGGPHTTHSISYSIHVISVLEMQNRLKQALDEERRELLQIQSDQQNAANLSKKAQSKPTPNLIQKANDSQNAVASETQALQQSMQGITQALKDNNMATPSQLQQRSEAKQILKQDTTTKMPTASSDATKAQNSTKSEQHTDLKGMIQTQKSISNDLDKVGELLQLPETPAELAAQAAQLAQEQKQLEQGSQAIAAVPHKKDEQTEAGQQAATRNATEQLQQNLEKSAEDAKQRGNETEAQALEKASQALQHAEVTAKQKQAENSLENGKPDAAINPQRQAAQALSDTAKAAKAATGSKQSSEEELEAEIANLQKMADKQRKIAKSLQNAIPPAEQKKVTNEENQLKNQAQSLSQNSQAAPGASQSLSKAQQNLSQVGKSMQSGQQESAKQPAQSAAQQLQKAADQAKKALQQMRQDAAAQKLADKVQRMAEEEHGLHDATQRIETEKQKGNLSFNSVLERRQIAGRQQNLQAEAKSLAPQFPSKAFQQAMLMASQEMNDAVTNLNKDDPDTSLATQQSEESAANTLDTIAHALQQQSSGSNSQPGQSGQQSQSASPQQKETAEALGELMLSQGLEQQLRRDTGKLDDSHHSDNQSSQEKSKSSTLAQRQGDTKSITKRAQESLQSVPDAAHDAGQAQQSMGEAQGRLQQTDPGKVTQHQQDAAITQLDQAIQSAQQALKKMQQQQQEKQQGEQGAPQQMQPGGKPGSQPMSGAFTRLQKAQGGATSKPQNSGGLNSQHISPQNQQGLNQGIHEHVPTGYQSLVHHYYSRVSGKGSK